MNIQEKPLLKALTGEERGTYPRWIDELVEIYANFSPDSEYLSGSFKAEVPLAVFFDCVEPVIAWGRKNFRENIRQAIKNTADAPFDLSGIEQLLTHQIGYILFDILNRTLVLELNVSRVKGELKGETPEDRFAHFASMLRQPDKIQTLIEEYPVLFKQAMDFMKRWVTVNSELVQRLYSDWQEIGKVFAIKKMAPLKKIQHSAGDRHNGGRTVTIITFASGEKVVYKPRPMSMDNHFQHLLEWFNRQGIDPPLKTLDIVDKQDYGWVEFVEHTPCNTKKEISRYHERLGYLLAILYMINATDFHSENIIASGEHPVLVDLESLFHYLRHYEDQSSSEAVFNSMERSVLKINLLPFKFYFDKKLKGVDLGGLTDLEGKENPKPTPLWSAEGTDMMKLTREYLPMEGRKNYPRYAGGPINLLDYANVIENSFRKGYQLIHENRGALLSENGILSSFSHDKVRILLRPTMAYAQLLDSSFHPDFLRDQADRDLLFARLHNAAGEKSITEDIIKAEQNALQRMDIPIFFTTVDSKDLIIDTEGYLADFFQATGMDDVRSKLTAFSREDCDKQCWFIRASLACSIDAGQHIGKDSYDFEVSENEASPGQLLDAARAVGDRLEQLAFRFNRTADWAGIVLKDDEQYEIRSMSVDLYSGLSGLAMFLGYLGKITGEPRYIALYEECFNTLDNYCSRYLKAKFSKYPGAFDGWGGIIHTFIHMGVLFDKPDYIARAEEIIDFIDDIAGEVKGFDILSGHAGLILSLLNLYKIKSHEQSLRLARRLGEGLVSGAQSMSPGKGWVIHSQRPLAGFAHGAAGIAYALSELYTVTGEKRFFDLAMEALAYERSLFLPGKGNWADLRDINVKEGNIDSEKVNMTAWCTGAAGVGTGRLGMLAHSYSHDEERMKEELNVAIETTLKQGFGKNHSLCHGDLGNLDFLLSASMYLKDRQLHRTVYRMAASIVASIDKNGFICGVPLRVENPGLMTGISGIGYQLLRLAKPEQVPSILLLAPPHVSSIEGKQAGASTQKKEN